MPLLLRHAALIEKEDASVFLAVAARPHLPSVTRLGEEAAVPGVDRPGGLPKHA